MTTRGQWMRPSAAQTASADRELDAAGRRVLIELSQQQAVAHERREQRRAHAAFVLDRALTERDAKINACTSCGQLVWIVTVCARCGAPA